MITAAPAEVFRLALVVLLLPVYWGMSRRLKPTPGRGFLVAGFCAIFFSFVMALFDEAAVAEILQHLGYAAAGVLILAGMLVARRAVIAERERT